MSVRNFLSGMVVSVGARWLKAATVAAASLALFGASAASAQSLTPVDLELFLSVDTSGSVDSSEYNLQQQGYVRAFQDAGIQAAIASKPNGVAVALGQWSTSADTPLAVGWTLLKTAADANAFASAINSISRQSSGSTCVACGINAAVASLQNNQFIGPSIIDVSGDGSQNQNDGSGPTASAAGARDAAAALGIKINGLPILGSEAGLDQWYRDNVQTADGFTLPANSFADFDAAVTAKISKEISGGGVPGPLPIAAAGVAFGTSRRLRQRLRLSRAAA